MIIKMIQLYVTYSKKSIFNMKSFIKKPKICLWGHFFKVAKDLSLKRALVTIFAPIFLLILEF
jgi:hypothetical protein